MGVLPMRVPMGSGDSGRGGGARYQGLVSAAATFAMASSTFWIFVRLRVTGGGVPRAVVEQCQLALRALGDLEADLSGGRLMKKQ